MSGCVRATVFEEYAQVSQPPLLPVERVQVLNGDGLGDLRQCQKICLRSACLCWVKGRQSNLSRATK